MTFYGRVNGRVLFLDLYFVMKGTTEKLAQRHLKYLLSFTYWLFFFPDVTSPRSKRVKICFVVETFYETQQVWAELQSVCQCVVFLSPTPLVKTYKVLVDSYLGFVIFGWSCIEVNIHTLVWTHVEPLNVLRVRVCVCLAGVTVWPWR